MTGSVAAGMGRARLRARVGWALATLMTLAAGVAAAPPSSAGVVGASPQVAATRNASSTATPAVGYTGLTVSQRLAGGIGTPETRSLDDRTHRVDVTGSRTATTERWAVTFTPVAGGAPSVVELVRPWGAGPLGVGSAEAYLEIDGRRCHSTVREVSIGEYVSDPATGRPTVLSVDLRGSCWGSTGNPGEYLTEAHLRLGASTPTGGLDLAEPALDWGSSVFLGEASTPLSQTARYVGAGSASVARVSMEPWNPQNPEYRDDFRVESDSCTGALLTDGSSCSVTVSLRSRGAGGTAAPGGSGLLQLWAADGRLLTQTALRYQEGLIDSAGVLMPTDDRVLDTRNSVRNPRAPVPAHGVVAFSVVGDYPLASVALGTSLVNLAAVTPGTGGYLSVLPPGATTSSTSSVNFVAGQTVSNLVLAPIDSKGMVRVLNSSDRPVEVVADIQGFIPARTTCGGSATGFCGERLHPVPLSRILDTRTTSGGARPLPVGTTTLTMRIPRGPYVEGVLATVTVVSPATSGWVQVGATVHGPAASVNYLPRHTTSNTVLARADRRDPDAVTIPVVVGGTPVHVVIDVLAVLDSHSSTAGVSILPLVGGAQRIADSRRGLGLSTLAGGRAGTLTVPSALRGPDTIGVVHNLTAIATHPTWLTAYPTGTARPVSSVLYVAVPGARAGTTMTLTSPAGALDIYSVAGPTDVVSDVAARVDLFPATERLRGFPRLPVGLPAISPVTRSR